MIMATQRVIVETREAIVRPWMGGTRNTKLKLQIKKDWKTQIATEEKPQIAF